MSDFFKTKSAPRRRAGSFAVWILLLSAFSGLLWWSITDNEGASQSEARSMALEISVSKSEAEPSAVPDSSQAAAAEAVPMVEAMPKMDVGTALGLEPDSGDQSWLEDFERMRAEVELTGDARPAAQAGLARLDAGSPEVEQAIHSFRPVPGIDPVEAGAYRAFYAWHPRQDLQLGLDPLGVSIAADGQHWSLRADSLEVNGAQESLPLLAERVDVASDAGYLQAGRLKQYIGNEAAAAQHWMTVDGEGFVSGSVRLRFDQVGDFNLSLEAGAQGLLLNPSRTDDAGSALRYHGLKAWDADGRAIAAEFELADGGMVIALQADSARYPLIIDPLIERVKGAGLGDLALTVASDIDIVAVGAPEFDYDEGTFDRFQAIMQAVEREVLKTTLGTVQAMFPVPNPIDMGKAFAVGVVSGFFTGSDYVDQAEEIAVLDNIGMVWVFSRGLDGWVLASTMDNIVESQTQARKSLDVRGVSYDEWRLGESLAVAGGQLLVGEPGRAYWELGDIPDGVTLVGQLIPGVGDALKWADGRPLHTKPRRKGAVYVFNHPNYDAPVQYIDGIFEGGSMYGEVGTKIVVEGDRAVIFSGESIEARRGTIVTQDETDTPSPKTSSWVAHHYTRSGSEWTRGISWHSYRRLTFNEAIDPEALAAYRAGLPILKAAALDRHGDLWSASVLGDTNLRIGRLTAGIENGAPLTVVSTSSGQRVSLDHWSGGALSSRSHLAIGMPDASSGAGRIQLVDTSSADRSQRPFLLDQTGETGQRLGTSVAAIDMALMASDASGGVQAWRADVDGWRAMTEEESGAVNDLEDVVQLAAGRFWTVALTADSDTEKGLEILSAEIPRTISGVMTYNGEPVAGVPVDAMEFIVLRGEGMEIEPFAYECGVNCDQRGADEPLRFGYQSGRFVELANYDLSGYWGPASTGRMIPLIGVEIEGAPDLRSLSFIGAGYTPGQSITREWGLYGRVRPLAASDAGGFRGAYYGEVAEDIFESQGSLRDPISASGWDELRVGPMRLNPPLIPNQDRLRLMMYDPYSSSPGRFTSDTGVGSDFVARLAMGKDASTRVVTDENGRFTITGLRPSMAGLRIARSPEDGSDPVRAGIYNLAEGGEDINLHENIAVSGIELRLGAGNYGFSGRVSAAGDKVAQTYRFSSEESPNNADLALSTDRAPGLEGLTVRAMNVSGVELEVTATTDADGVYVFEDLLPGDYSVEVLGLDGDWQSVAPRKVESTYLGGNGRYEFVYRQRGLIGGRVVGGYQIPVGSGNIFQKNGFVFGSDSEAREAIADALPFKVDGELVAYEYAREDAPFKYPYNGDPELQRLRDYHEGADFSLEGSTTIRGAAPLEGTRIRWANSLGQTGIVTATGGVFQLEEMAPGNYTFEVLDGGGYAAETLTRTVAAGAVDGRVDFVFKDAGAVILSGLDARGLAGHTPSDVLDFRQSVKLIATEGDQTAAHTSAVNVAAGADSGTELLSLEMTGLDAGGDRAERSYSFRSNSLTGNWTAIYTGSNFTDHSGQIAALAEVSGVSPGAKEASLRLEVLTYGASSSDLNRFVLIDPLGGRHPFSFGYSSTDYREVLIEGLDLPPVDGEWKIEVSAVVHPLNLYAAELRFDDALSQRSGYGQATLAVSDASGSASALEWIDPFGRSYPVVIPASDSSAVREVSLDYLPPVNGEWTLHPVEVRASLTLQSAALRFPNSGSRFSLAMDALGDGRAPSVPGGDYWLEILPRLGGSQPLAFVADRRIEVREGQSTAVTVRGEPLTQVEVQAVDRTGASVGREDLGGAIFVHDESTPGQFWQLAPVSDGTTYRGLMPWWAQNVEAATQGELVFTGLQAPWTQWLADGQVLNRGSRLNQAIDVVEDVIAGQLIDRGESASGVEVALDTGEKQQTDEDGWFRFRSAESGSRVISVTTSGYDAVHLDYQGGTSLLELRRVIEPLSGRVLREGGVPVPGVTVSLSGNGETASVKSDQGGRFAFDLPEGDYTLNFSKRFYSNSGSISATHVKGGSVLADVSLARELEDISGQISRGDSGLEGISLRLTGGFYWQYRGEPEASLNRVAVTDADGRYTFEDVPVGAYRIQPLADDFYFEPSRLDYRGYTETSWSQEQIDRLSQTDSTASGSSVAGSVILGGEALGGVRISVENDSGIEVARVVSNADGKYQLPTLQAGTYQVRAIGGEANFNAQFDISSRELVLSGDEDLELGAFTVRQATNVFTVTDELGDAISDAVVQISGIRDQVLTTDASGVASTTLPAGDYRVSYSADGVSFDDREAATGLAKTVQLRGTENAPSILGFRGGVATGRVLLDGEPLAGIEVVISPGYSDLGIEPTRTDSEGNYRFERLPREVQTIHLLRDDQARYNLLTERSLLVADVTNSRDTVNVPDLALVSFGEVTGQVTWKGAPVANVSVRLSGQRDLHGHERSNAVFTNESVRTDAAGNFRFPAIPAATGYSLTAFPGCTVLDESFDGVVGATGRIGLRLAVTDLTTTQLYIGQDAFENFPVTPDSLTLNGYSIDLEDLMTTGSVSLDLPFGVPLRYELSAAGYADQSGEISAQGAAINLVLDPARQVSGQVVDPDGQPMAGVEVIVDQLRDGQTWSNYKRATTDAAGTFHIAELYPDARYTVRTRAEQTIGGRTIYLPEHLNRRVVAPGVADYELERPLLGSPIPEEDFIMPFEAYVVGQADADSIRVRLPEAWTAPQSAYAVSFWLRSSQDWFNRSGLRLALQSTDTAEFAWRLEGGQFYGASDTAFSPEARMAANRWQRIGLQFYPVQGGKRRVSFYRFGVLVDEWVVPASAEAVGGTSDLSVSLATGDRFAGLQVEPGEWTLDERAALNEFFPAFEEGSLLSINSRAEAGYIWRQNGGAELIQAPTVSGESAPVSVTRTVITEGATSIVELDYLSVDYAAGDVAGTHSIASAGFPVGESVVDFGGRELTVLRQPLVERIELSSEEPWTAGLTRSVTVYFNYPVPGQGIQLVVDRSGLEGMIINGWAGEQYSTFVAGGSESTTLSLTTRSADDLRSGLLAFSNSAGTQYGELEFTILPSLFDVTGQIANSLNDEGIAGLTVRLGGKQTTTDSNGRYAFANVSRGSHTLSTLNDGWSFAGNNSRTVVVADAPLEVDPIVATGQNFLNGTLGEAGYSPLAGVTVYLSGPGLSQASAVTDVNGNYRFSQLGEGVYTLYVNDKQFLPTRQELAFSLTDWSHTQDLAIKQGVLSFSIIRNNSAPWLASSIVAARTYTVRPTGFSYDSSAGQWAADYKNYAQIRDELNSETHRFAIAKTETERYRVRALVSNQIDDWQAHAYALDSYGVGAGFGFDERSFWGDGTPVDFAGIAELNAPEEARVLAVRGDTGYTLLTPDSRSYAGFVQEKINATASIKLTSVPDEDLTFYLQSSHPEYLTVPPSVTFKGAANSGTDTEVKIPLFSNPVESPVDVKLTLLYGLDRFAGRSEATVTLVPAQTVEGHVVDVTGRGMPDVTVTDGVYHWQTDAKGDYRVEATDPSQAMRVELVLDDDNLSVEPAAYPFGANLLRSFEGYDFVLKGPHSVSGAIQGLADASADRVTVDGLGLQTNSSGGFALDGMLAGTYQIRPELAGYRFEPAQIELVLPRDSGANLEFTALRSFSLSGRVTTDGRALAAASVALRDDEGASIAVAQTNEGGGFAIDAEFSPGGVEWVVSAEGYADRVIDFDPEATSPLTVALALNEISGQVLRADQDPVAAGIVRVAGQSTATDANGLYFLTGIPAGSLDFEIQTGDARFIINQAVPAGGGTFTDFDLALESRISGRLSDAEGDSIAGATVALTGTDAPKPLPLSFAMNLSFDPTGEYTYEEKFFQIERTGLMEDLEISLVLSGAGAPWAVIDLVYMGITGLVPPTITTPHPVDEDGKVRLSFTSIGSDAANADFRSAFASNLKGKETAGYWNIYLGSAYRRNPYNPSTRIYRSDEVVTLESIQINPITPGVPAAAITTTDANGDYNFEPLPGSYTVAVTESGSSDPVAPAVRAVDTRIGPAVVDFAASAHPAVQWTVPASFNLDTDSLSQLQTATASVAGRFDYSPGALADLSSGEAIVQLTFTPSDSAYPSRTLERTIVVTRQPTEFEEKLGPLARLLPPEQIGPMADADGDGVPNVLELFTGRSLTGIATDAPMMQLHTTGTTSVGEETPEAPPVGMSLIVPAEVSFTSGHQPTVEWGGHRITIQGSFDLGDFDAPVREITPPAGATAPAGYRVRAFELNASDAPRGFMRMSVEPMVD